MELEKVRLTGAQETTLATLYGKAMESRRPDFILEDRDARRPLVRHRLPRRHRATAAALPAAGRRAHRRGLGHRSGPA